MMKNEASALVEFIMAAWPKSKWATEIIEAARDTIQSLPVSEEQAKAALTSLRMNDKWQSITPARVIETIRGIEDRRVKATYVGEGERADAVKRAWSWIRANVPQDRWPGVEGDDFQAVIAHHVWVREHDEARGEDIEATSQWRRNRLFSDLCSMFTGGWNTPTGHAWSARAMRVANDKFPLAATGGAE